LVLAACASASDAALPPAPAPPRPPETVAVERSPASVADWETFAERLGRLRGLVALVGGTSPLEDAELVRKTLKQLALCIEAIPVTPERARLDAASRLRSAAFDVWVEQHGGERGSRAVREALDVAAAEVVLIASATASNPAEVRGAVVDLQRAVEALPRDASVADDRPQLAQAFDRAAGVLEVVQHAAMSTAARSER
jgi:hypothetical protein